MTILVTAATGNVGRLVVDRLVAAGARVRALTRNPAIARFPSGVQVVRGTLGEPRTLGGAFDGVERMYLFAVPGSAREVVAMAAAAGVRHVVVLSSGAVPAGLDTTHHLPVERAVEESGLAWTHVRPGEFMLNKLWLWGPSIRAERLVREPFPDVALRPVHEQDVADVAAGALLGGGHEGRAYTLEGPEAISHRDQVAAIATALGEEVAVEVVTPERARELYLAQGGFAADNADFLLGFAGYDGGEPEAAPEPGEAGPAPTARDVTGRPARTFAQWARDHVEDFR